MSNAIEIACYNYRLKSGKWPASMTVLRNSGFHPEFLPSYGEFAGIEVFPLEDGGLKILLIRRDRAMFFEVVDSIRMPQTPNKAPEPTPGAVTPRATEGDSE